MAKAEKSQTKFRKRRKKNVSNTHVFDFRRPVPPETSLDVGRSWLAEGRMIVPNKGVFTPKQFGDAHRAIAESEDAGKLGASIPPLYDPLRRLVAWETNAKCAISGQKQRAPKQASDFPNWREGDRLTDAVPLRLCHASDARDLVTNRDVNVLLIGEYNYVVGTITESGGVDLPAPFLINGARTGNYFHNLVALKRLSFDGMNEVNSLVGRFNANFEIVHLDDHTDPGVPIAASPNMLILDWGYFYRENKKMTLAQIRAAVREGDINNITYKAEYTAQHPLIGRSVSSSEFWAAVKKEMARAATKRDDKTAYDRFQERKPRTEIRQEAAVRAWHNLADVQTRTDPRELYPFGFYSTQTCCPPVSHFDEHSEKQVRFVLGCHIGAEYATGRAEKKEQKKAKIETEQSSTEAAPVTESITEPTEKIATN